MITSNCRPGVTILLLGLVSSCGSTPTHPIDARDSRISPDQRAEADQQAEANLPAETDVDGPPFVAQNDSPDAAAKDDPTQTAVDLRDANAAALDTALEAATGKDAALADSRPVLGCATCGPSGEVLGALCDVIARCPETTYPIASRSRTECIAILGWTSTCHLANDKVGNEHRYWLEQRIPALDSIKAAACTNWLNTAPCSAFIGRASADGGATVTANPCAGIVHIPPPNGPLKPPSTPSSSSTKPLAAAGEICDSSRSSPCQAGLFCDAPRFDPDAGSESCSVCRPLPRAGERCGNDDLCAAGLHCRWQDPNVTASRYCSEPVADGIFCNWDSNCASGFCGTVNWQRSCAQGGDVGAPCTRQDQCRTVNFCNPGSGRCEGRHKTGEACTSNDFCQYHTCDPVLRVCGLPDGKSCYWNDECLGRQCSSNMRTCTTLKPNGEACSNNRDCISQSCWGGRCIAGCTGDQDCPLDLYCSSDSNTCLPLKSDGSQCDQPAECLSGWCGMHDVCQKKPKIGDSCQQSPECYPQGFCKAGVCAARVGPGEACQELDSCRDPFICRNGRCDLINLECRPSDVGEVCAFLRLCADDAYCDGYGSFTCKARKQAGEACSGNDQCIAELGCARNGTTGPSVCVPRKQVGQACENDECVAGAYCIGSAGSRVCAAAPAGQPCDVLVHCPTGYQCNQDYRCEPPRALGQQCLMEHFSCQAGLFCDSFDGCQPLLGTGQSCNSSAECQQGLFCESIDKCQPLGTLDKPCRNSNECAAEFYCDEHTDKCAPRARAGEICTNSSSTSYKPLCLAPLFCEWNSVSSASTCQDLRSVGQPCDKPSSTSDPSQCKAGLFCDYDSTAKDDACQAPRAIGQHCATNDQCQSKVCGKSSVCVTAAECVKR